MKKKKKSAVGETRRSCLHFYDVGKERKKVDLKLVFLWVATTDQWCFCLLWNLWHWAGIVESLVVVVAVVMVAVILI